MDLSITTFQRVAIIVTFVIYTCSALRKKAVGKFFGKVLRG